ncbi:MAG: septation regulator SpoVG [Clostridia bacterium]|nr:septation regulator SpoVG [Clostridia bacterium]
MEITDVKIRKIFDEGQIKAIVSVTFDNSLAVHDIKIIEGNSRIFVATPSRKSAEGEYRDIVHPINADFRADFEKKILEEYNRIIQ